MKLRDTDMAGLRLIELESHSDERGSFTRVFCEDVLREAGVPMSAVQVSVSENRLRGTLRGLHFQAAPHAEVKVVRCSRGAIFDVVVDLRPGSDTFQQWRGFELHAGDGQMLLVPQGCAHGFQTLADDTEVTYFISTRYVPAATRGVRWNDPAFDIQWPLAEAPILSPRDAACPDFEPDEGTR